MRQIKFRAWDKIGEVMVYQDRITIAENGNWILMAKPGSDFEGRGIPLMQFTGLHDKNGKEIYESDILQLDGMNIIVEWIHDEHRLGWSPYISCNGNTGFEIIGNIYENPELLPVKE